MAEEIAELKNKIVNLEKRLRVSNREKANLLMAVNLIQRVSNVTGVKDVVEYILQILSSAIGGTNISIYYEAENQWRYVDILGKKLWLDSIDDELVKQTVEQRSFQKEKEREGSSLTIPGFPKTYETWVYPLQVQNHYFGAIRLQGMAIEHAHYRDNIDPFIQYSALILYHEVSNLKSLQSAYQKVRKAKESLQASEEKFSKTFQNAPLMMTISSVEDGSYIDVNDAFVQQTGYTREEALGSTSIEIGFISEHNREQLLDELKSSGRVRNLEIDLNKADGTKMTCLYSGELIKIEGTVRLLSIAVNITEQRIYEMQIQKAQRMESIGNLAGGIAHDFNNILFPIVGMSELLLEDLPLDSPLRENVDEILRAGKRGSDLVKQILAFSRQSEHKLIPIKIQSVLKEVIKLCRATIPTFIEIDQNIQQDCGMVLADPTQVHQIAMNIMTNAYHAVEANGGKITVSLETVTLDDSRLRDNKIKSGRYASLTISDTGHGIPPDMLEKIFEPYYTTKEKGKGTGLGLAVVFGIVKEHQGDINVYSELGKGTTFEVYLPLLERYSKEESIEVVDEIIGGKERILLVDDEEPIARTERQMLERIGYKVTSRLNSIEALEVFRANPGSFDLLISDMNMPIMNGIQLAEAVLSIRSDFPIVIFTGFSDRLDIEKVQRLGIKGFMMKPIVRSDMAKMVRKVLDEAKKAPHE